jgi:hypothetical protein
MARLVGEDVLGLVEQLLRLGLDRARTFAASAMCRASAAAFSAISTSTDLRRLAASVSRTVLTFSSASARQGARGIGLGAGGDSSSDLR